MVWQRCGQCAAHPRPRLGPGQRFRARSATLAVDPPRPVAQHKPRLPQRQVAPRTLLHRAAVHPPATPPGAADHTHTVSRQRLTLAAVVRTHQKRFCRQVATSAEQRRVLSDITACRTQALDGHVFECEKCGQPAAARSPRVASAILYPPGRRTELRLLFSPIAVGKQDIWVRGGRKPAQKDVVFGAARMYTDA